MSVLITVGIFLLEVLKGQWPSVWTVCAAVQVVCWGVWAALYINISQNEELDSIEVSPDDTAKDHDLERWSEELFLNVVCCLLLGSLYFCFGYRIFLLPLIVFSPYQLLLSPLFDIHVLGAELKRPFPSSGLLPSAPNHAQREKWRAQQHKVRHGIKKTVSKESRAKTSQDALNAMADCRSPANHEVHMDFGAAQHFHIGDDDCNTERYQQRCRGRSTLIPSRKITET